MVEVKNAPVTISSLDFENVKRVKAVKLQPTSAGLTVIGGRNAQGKTSVLDAICWALGGNKYRPEEPHRDGSVADPSLKVVLSNGVVVERKGKSGTLKVTDPSGAKAGQALLDSFVEQFALDVPRFLAQGDKEKALTVLKIIGVEDELERMEREEAALTQKRLTAGQMERQQRGAAETMPHHEGVMECDVVDIADLAEQQRDAIEHNAQNQRARDALASMEAARDAMEREVEDMQARLDAKGAELFDLTRGIAEAKKRVEALADVDTSGMADAMAAAQELNAKIADNQAWNKAMKRAAEYHDEWEGYDSAITRLRNARLELLAGADMPLDGLTVEDGRLVFGGHVWSDMSGSEQMRVATAIVRRLNPQCGFVLVDKLEQMDSQTLAEFADWCAGEGLQVIGTRVSTGDECSVIIEDGLAIGAADPEPTDGPTSTDAPAPALLPATPTVEPPTPLFALATEGRAF